MDKYKISNVKTFGYRKIIGIENIEFEGIKIYGE